jgi:hypothetical protein
LNSGARSAVSRDDSRSSVSGAQHCPPVLDKAWVHGPGQGRWEVYVVKHDGTSLENQPADCCTGDGCTAGCCSTETADVGA